MSTLPEKQSERILWNGSEVFQHINDFGDKFQRLMISLKQRQSQGKRIKNNHYPNHHFSVIIKEKW